MMDGGQGLSDNSPYLGVIGGSGLYDMAGLEEAGRMDVDTPFGRPSDSYVCGRIGATRVAFLARHGQGHHISPSDLNFCANLHGFKQLGVDAVVSISAVGSLREEIAPGDLLIPDQFIDRTRGRISTFFGDGIVAHVSLADPVCAGLSALLAEAALSTGVSVHRGGTYVCMEGPQFSTRAESQLYRSWGGQVIGMTNIQEAKLAREAELCFSTLALVTDYDCWRSGEGGVDVNEILAVLGANVEVAKSVVGVAARRFDGMADCGCKRALDGAVITDSCSIPAQRHQQLDLILKRVETGGAETAREKQV